MVLAKTKAPSSLHKQMLSFNLTKKRHQNCICINLAWVYATDLDLLYRWNLTSHVLNSVSIHPHMIESTRFKEENKQELN